MLKNRIQNTSIKVQSSISHTPEGTGTGLVLLAIAVPATTTEVNNPTVVEIHLAIGPVVTVSGRVPISSTRISWIQ
jgi:hypothetical protein